MVRYKDVGERWDSVEIDHLLVLPHGIFLIETKNWDGKRINEDPPHGQQRGLHALMGAGRQDKSIGQLMRRIGAMRKLFRGSKDRIGGFVCLVGKMTPQTLADDDQRMVVTPSELMDRIRKGEGNDVQPTQFAKWAGELDNWYIDKALTAKAGENFARIAKKPEDKQKLAFEMIDKEELLRAARVLERKQRH